MTAWMLSEPTPVDCAFCCEADAVDEWSNQPICSECYERVAAESCEDCGHRPCGCPRDLSDDGNALSSVYGPDNDDYSDAAE